MGGATGCTGAAVEYSELHGFTVLNASISVLLALPGVYSTCVLPHGAAGLTDSEFGYLQQFTSAAARRGTVDAVQSARYHGEGLEVAFIDYVVGPLITVVVKLFPELADLEANCTDVATVLSATSRPTYVRVASYAFGLGVLVSGIPVNIIITRDNLLAARMSRGAANALAMVLPWCISWIVYESTAFGTLVDYSGLLVVAPLALVVPFVVYLAMQKPPPDEACPPTASSAWFLQSLAETDTICAEQPPDGEPKARYPGGWHGAVAWTALFVILVIIVATFAEIVAQIQATSS